jgi:uncharacterized protein (TIGR03435 family)
MIRTILSPLLALIVLMLGQNTQLQTRQRAFEVASVRQSNGPQPIGMTVDGARVKISNTSLAELIDIAFKTKPYEVSGPDWLAPTANAFRFDIQAKLPEGASEKDAPEMLQTLLEERFMLKWHRESLIRSVYALVVEKNGIKMKRSVPEAADDEASSIGVKQDSKNTVSVTGGPSGPMKTTVQPGGGIRIEYSKIRTSGFADVLARYVGRPVLDSTRLAGNYQVVLDISREDLMNLYRLNGVATPAPNTGPPSSEAGDPAGTSILRSVQELGLNLEPRRSSIPVLVIDHLEKTPSEN